jgi:hypothetical protein
MQLYRTLIVVILKFYCLVCALAFSCALNKPVIQLLVCALQRLDECVRLWYNQFKGIDSVRNLNLQDDQEPLRNFWP